MLWSLYNGQLVPGLCKPLKLCVKTVGGPPIEGVDIWQVNKRIPIPGHSANRRVNYGLNHEETELNYEETFKKKSQNNCKTLKDVVVITEDTLFKRILV